MNPAELTRTTAASLLNDARRTHGPGRSALTGWAATALPDSRAAVRLYVRTLIELDDLASAEALLARMLLQYPADPSLATLRAEVLLLLGRPEEAAGEIQVALRRRRTHGRTLEIAGDVALADGRAAEAVGCYEQALDRHVGHHGGLRDKLVTALLGCGRTNLAAREVRSGSPLLQARVLRAQGRLLEAADRLEHALGGGLDPELADRMHAELIDTLEAQGDVRRLSLRLEGCGPESVARAGRALLGLGEFDRAARLVASFARHRHRTALHVLVVAAAQCGRRGLARRALHRLSLVRGGFDRSLMAECWRLGLSGRLLDCSGRMGSDRSPSLLEPLLRQAVHTFQVALEAPDARIDRAETERHRAICVSAIAA